MEAIKDALVKCGWSHYEGNMWWKDGVIKSFEMAVVEELEERAEQMKTTA